MAFYKDVLFLVGGIIVVGVLVFGGLSLLAGGDGPPSDTSTTVDVEAQLSTTTTTAATASTSTTTTTTPATTEVTSPPTTLRTPRPPDEVRVVVLNSIGVVGLAAGLSDELAGIGYQMAQPDNYTPELTETMVFHADGFSLEALELADSIPDGTVAPNPEVADTWGTDIVVVIGRSYQG